MQEYSVYVLQSLKDHRHYVDLSQNPPKRLQQHNAGKVFSTKSRRPLILIYSEKIGSLQNARKRELYLKSGAGRRFLNSILQKNKDGGGSLPDC
ncbi:MAG TPA: GIY-YIG nuclease family protein [Bacteroidota bacterium]|nr:GIY-YIG nuclease family protein [Bacteroidota bacterium]